MRVTLHKMLILKIYGTDEDGRPFFEDASAFCLTKQTAVLEGITHRLKSGSMLGLEYNARNARAQIMWVGDMDQSSRANVGIRLLATEGCPWECLFQAQAGMQESDVERRQHPRHRIRVVLDLETHNFNSKLQVQCSDISVSGCYVHTFHPWPIGTHLVAGIWLNSERIEATAVVRASEKDIGMGIEFIHLNEEEDRRLQQFLACSLSDLPVQF